jgi:DNA-binding NarL/FixJ family response regulator
VQLACFAATISPAPVVALVDFPRLAECEEVRAAGAAVVMPKPCLLDDLLWQVKQVLHRETPASLPEAA